MEKKLSITSSALEKILAIADKKECLRITVEPGGCNGFEYKFEVAACDNVDILLSDTDSDHRNDTQLKRSENKKNIDPTKQITNLADSSKKDPQTEPEGIIHVGTNEKYYILHTGRVILEVDNASLELIHSSEIDYVRALIGEKFTIKNPNSRSRCSCGSSFGI